MDRRAKSPKGKAEPKRLPARTPPKNDGARVRDLEKRLAESLDREKATGRTLQEKDRALTEALDHQTATSEVLGVISASPTNVQSVFETIVSSARRLCEASFSSLNLLEGGKLMLSAAHGIDDAVLAAARQTYPQPVDRTSTSGRAILERRVVHIEDSTLDPEYPNPVRAALGLRCVLTIPLLRKGQPLGAVSVWRTEVRPFTEKQIALLQTFADQAVIALENARLFGELTEALEQQTATSEILRVISRSPTDIQPVFDAIGESALRLCAGIFSNVCTFDGELIHLVATHNWTPAALEIARRIWPSRPNRELVTSRAVLERRVVQVPDVVHDYRESEHQELIHSIGYRSVVAVPMLRGDVPLGVIGVARAEPGPFPDNQIALLQTFADQAVIAIENVRLFTELQEKNRALTQAHGQVSEALEQQTATAEILSVISGSPTDVRPVFAAVLDRALTLCDASNGSIYQFEDGVLRHVGLRGPHVGIEVGEVFPLESSPGRAILEKRTVHLEDILQELDWHAPEVQAGVQRAGIRTIVALPLLREQTAVGAIVIRRLEVRPFSEKQIRLLKTFADQAVIAIENVRLFTELQEKNQALTHAHAQVTESLEQQTATAEILRVISRSQTDVQPVFDTIVRSAVPLCGGLFSALYQFDGELIHSVAQHNFTPEALAEAHRVFPARPSRALYSGRAILESAIVHIPDSEVDPEHQHRALRRAIGWRSGLFVPMLREGAPIGVIEVARAEPGPFSDSEIELLRTFAAQAVIAVENVRLFKELEARTAALTRSVEQLTALGEVGRAVSSTLDLETVLTTIVSRAVELTGLDGGVVFEYDEATGEFVQRVATETAGALAEARRTVRIQKGEGVVGRTALTLEPVQVPDITVPGAHGGRLRDTLIESGVRAVLAVPMVYERRLIGSLGVTRNRPGEFPAETIELLRTFATQSALAIQNARLFREIEDKSRQLEVASQHKSEFLANMSHELRTPLNAVIGFSEVLAEGMFGEINEKQAEYLRDILESGRHLLSLINDILDLSKIEAGRMELEATDFDLPSAIDNALILVRERATRRGITLGRTLDERLGIVRGDERKVKQVLLNLLSNALKFTPEGGRIDVRVAMSDGMVEVSVADTGVGIAPEDQEAIFEEFRQVGTADKKVEGTGLGLALSRKFIELHGGRIWVKSQVGHGSTFTFTLRVRREPGDPNAPTRS